MNEHTWGVSTRARPKLPRVRKRADGLKPVGKKQKNKKTIRKQIEHHDRPRRASATAPLRTGVDTCKTGSGADRSSGALTEPDRRRSNHERTEDPAGRCHRRDGG